MINLNDLNNNQREAVITTEGPLLIIAGAGSGKTRVLTYRIAYLIEHGTDPYNILAITFTNKAAKEMRDRVNDVVDGGNRVWVSTFHSMCVRILRRFADRIGFTGDFAIYDTDDAKSVMREAIKARNLDTKSYKERVVLNVISGAKDRMIDPRQMLTGARGMREENYANLYADYQAALKKNNAMDFDDLIFHTVNLLKSNPDVLETFANRFKYMMVDEYQDTNTSQFELVSLLASKWNNLCVVGDDDQSIYKFRGANIENILSFEDEFKNTKVIKLEENYRSTKTILDAANAVVKNNCNRKDKTLYTGNEQGEKVKFLMYNSAYDEAQGIAGKIEYLVHDGWEYSDIAILYRTNAQSRTIEEKLVYNNIPYRMYGGVNFYARREIKDVLSYLKAVANESDAQAIKRIINVPKRGIGQTTVERIQNYSDIYGITFWEALTDCENNPEITPATAKKIHKFTDMIAEFKETAGDGTIEELANEILEKTGYIDYLGENDSPEELADRRANIDELINKIIAYESDDKEESYDPATGEALSDLPISLDGFLEEVSLIADVGENDTDPNRVVMMTLHSAKGLEFPIVFMAGMEEGLFPSYISADDDEELEEERRLCYVGMTRAEKMLYLTFAAERMVHGERRSAVPSRFVREIPQHLLETDNLSGLNSKRETVFTKEYEPRATSTSLDKKPLRLKSGSVAIPQNTVGKYSSRVNIPRKTERDRRPTFGRAFPADGNIKRNIPGKPLNGSDSLSGAVKTGNVLKTNDTESSQSNNKAATTEKFSVGEAPYIIGQRVSNDRFGHGVVTDIKPMSNDWLVTVEFDEGGQKKMLTSFIKLNVLE
ncbi:MAG: 3'-5' exonuclease [Lachnospiraceae bacterium]|nr:UvrD-helicase domain-containing protein [Lachnospiraceae bacterium]MDY2956826.1 3'-5' exonuclease [Lachnospiraceae bacterium]